MGVTIQIERALDDGLGWWGFPKVVGELWGLVNFARNKTRLFLFLIFIYLFRLRRVLVAACVWDLVPPSGIEPGPPALGARSLTHWTTM